MKYLAECVNFIRVRACLFRLPFKDELIDPQC